jgi:hypothetical protein
MKVDVVVTTGTTNVIATKQAISSIPIVLGPAFKLNFLFVAFELNFTCIYGQSAAI